MELIQHLLSTYHKLVDNHRDGTLIRPIGLDYFQRQNVPADVSWKTCQGL